MSTPLSEYVSVTVTIADRLIQAIDFGVPIVFDEFMLPTSWDTGQRVKAYADIAAVGDDFATTTKVYKACAAIFTSDSAFPSPSTVKVGRADSGDADITASLAAIELYDPDWYALVAIYRLEADLNTIAAWIQAASNPHICFLCSEDAGVIDSAIAIDIASDLQLAAYSRSSYLWSHNGGVDATGAAYTVTSLVATITQASHGLRVGDSVTFSGSTGEVIDGNNTVATVPTSGTYTVVTTAIDEAGPVTVDYFARYAFPEARWVGAFIPTVAGAVTWAFKELTGQIPTPTSLLNLTQQRAARDKNANIYTTISGLGATQEGKMASGRYIDVQIGADWLAVRCMERVNQRLLTSKKISFTDEGISIFQGDIAEVLNQAITNQLLAPTLADDTAGRPFTIEFPAVADISAGDKAARNVPLTNVTVRFAGAIHNVNIAISASV